MRIDQLTFTRFIAAIAIVVFHYGLGVFPFNVQFITSFFQQANVGVSYFFILSGFVMIIAYGNKSKISWLEYYLNRFARIYPVYFLAIALLLFYKLFTHSILDFNGLILNILAIQAWSFGHALSFNSPGWSLSVEFFFYLLFPFLYNSIYRSKKIKIYVFSIVVLWVFSQLILNFGVNSSLYKPMPSKSHDFFYYFPLMHLNEFLIGNLAGIYYLRKFKSLSKNYDWIIVFCILTLLIFLKWPFGLNYHNGLLAVIFIPLIILLSINNGKLTALLNTKVLVFLGEISYSIYILQFPVFIYSAELFNLLHINNLFVRFYSSLLILIFSSAISYKFIETPMRNKIKAFKLKIKPVWSN